METPDLPVPEPRSPNLKEQISAKLGIPLVSDWSIGDSDKNGLVLVTISDHADVNTYGHLHGVILDADLNPINGYFPPVAHTYGHEPVVISDQIRLRNGQLDMMDTTGQLYNYDLSGPQNSMLLKQGQEGVFLRVFMFRDYYFDEEGNKLVRPKMYIATRRRLTADGRWGSHDNPTFVEMYKKYNGPTLEQLYDTTKRYSPIVHNFLIVHPSLQHVSKEQIRDGYMVYVGTSQMWDENTSPYPNELVDWNSMAPSNITSNLELIKENPSLFMYNQPILSIEDANDHLRYGYNDEIYTNHSGDERLGFGEFVIMIIFQGDYVAKQFRIHSPAYAWRRSIRNENPNLRHQFYDLTTDALGFFTTPRGKQGSRSQRRFVGRHKDQNQYLRTFLQKYPITNHDVDGIIERINASKPLTNVQVIHDPNEIRRLVMGPNPRDSIDSCIKIIWTSLILTVPFHEQAAVASFYDDFLDDRDDLINWVRNLWTIEDYETFFQEDDSKNFVRIISEAKKSAQKAIEESKGEGDASYSELVGTGISNLIMKERGKSLYKMIKMMYSIEDTTKAEASTYTDLEG